MSEKYRLVQQDPRQELSNVIAVFYSSQEPTRFHKKIHQSYSVLNSSGNYTFFNSNNPSIVAIEIDLHLNAQEYKLHFESIIPWLISNYGSIILISLPECDNFQSIALGLFKVINGYINDNTQFKIYTDGEDANILKPIVESNQFERKKVEIRKNYIFEYFSCSECGKFPYIPLVKTCCNLIICARCGNRDTKKCSQCLTEISTKPAEKEIENICSKAPYLCKCGTTIEFRELEKHIQSCFTAEIECRICNEKTKFNNFPAHFRMCHMDKLAELVNGK